MRLKQFLIQSFSLGIIFAFSLAILLVKTAYVFKDARFMPFGFDAPRIIGYTQQLLQFGTLDPDASYRYGLPLFAGFFVKFLSLPPSDTFVIPLWLINIGGGLLLTLSAWYLTKSKTIAVLSLALYSGYAEVALVNDSYFMNLIVAPLRLLFLFLFTRLNIKVWQKWLSFFSYGFLVLYGNLTYPIISSVLDVITITYLGYLLLHRIYLRKRFALIIFIQLATYALIFTLYRFGAGHPIAITKYVEYVYVLNMLEIDHWLVAKVVLGFIAFEVLALLFFILYTGNVQKRNISLPKLSLSNPVLVKVWPRFSKILVGVGIGLFLVSGFNQLIPALGIFSDFLALPGISLMNNWWIMALILGALEGIKRVPKRKQLPFTFLIVVLATYMGLYFLFPGSMVARIVRNKRLVVFFLPYILIMFGAGLSQLKKPLFLTLSSLFVLLSLVASWQGLKQYFRFPARQDTLQAMDWFSKQPNHTNVLFYATYFNNPNLTGHEKYYGLYFVNSRIPYRDQRLLGKCTESEKICTQRYIDYIRQNKVTYLVLEYGNGNYIFENLSQLGEIIYDNGVRIIRI